MQQRHSRTLKAMRRVVEFVDSVEVDPRPALLIRMRASLAASMERIAKLGVAQLASVSDLGGEPRRVDQLRRRIRRERMAPLIKVAKPLLKFAPGTAAALRVPHAHASTADVATAALRLADVLKPHSKLMASAGFSKAFIDEMREEARALAAAVKRNEKARRRRSQTTAAVAAEFKKAMGTMTVIEGILTPFFEADGVSAAVWRTTRRVTARTGRPTNRMKRHRELKSAAPLAPPPA